MQPLASSLLSPVFRLSVSFSHSHHLSPPFPKHSNADYSDPNCWRLGMGGNFALFAAKAIKKNEELTHSYVSPHQLLGTAKKRAAHLFFQCQCLRCTTEDDVLRSRLGNLGFKPGFAATELGKAIGNFKIALALNNGDDRWHENASSEKILLAGQNVVLEMKRCKWCASARPLATLEIVSPFLDLFFTALASQDPAATSAFPPVPCDTRAIDPSTAARRFGIQAAVVFLSEASKRILELSDKSILPVAPCRLLLASSQLQQYLLGGKLRQFTIPELRAALETFDRYFSLDALREDIACLNVWPALCSPSLGEILKGEGSCSGLNDDECGGCRTKITLALCTRCKQCKFCSKECLRRNWSSHKIFCQSQSGTNIGETAENERRADYEADEQKDAARVTCAPEVPACRDVTLPGDSCKTETPPPPVVRPSQAAIAAAKMWHARHPKCLPCKDIDGPEGPNVKSQRILPSAVALAFELV
jgi:hypothetical protein